MGSGSAALIWYFACAFAVAFITIVACGLVLFGRRKERKRREARLAARTAAKAESGAAEG